jgi:hypothetical protein
MPSPPPPPAPADASITTVALLTEASGTTTAAGRMSPHSHALPTATRTVAPQAIVAAPAAPLSPPSAPSVSASPAPMTASSARPASDFDRISEAVKGAVDRHDPSACNAALVGLGSGGRADALRSVCVMAGGDCERGARGYAAALKLSPTAVPVIEDDFCVPGNDPPTRLRRLSLQTTGRLDFDCRYYLTVARAAERDASSDRDRMAVDGALATIAKCFGTSGDCNTAKDIWKDVVALNPRWQGQRPDIGRNCAE